MDVDEQTTKNRMVLLLIAGIPVTMILTATWLWFFVVKGDLDLVGMLGTANRGTLVQPPRQLDELELADESGASFKYADLEPKWSLLVPVSEGRCELVCEKSLYVTRQIHVAMGKEFNRIRRLVITDASVADVALDLQQLSDGHALPPTFTELLESEHRGTRALSVGVGEFTQLFAEYPAAPDSWYLVDPGGWVMMRYDGAIHYKDVISDLKFLLKNSGG